MRRREFVEQMTGAALLARATPVPRTAVGQGVAQDRGTLALPEKSTPEFFYRPTGAWAGDFIPFFRPAMSLSWSNWRGRFV